MKYLILIVMLLGIETMNAESIDKILDNFEKGIEIKYFAYDVYDVLILSVDEKVWPDYTSLSEPKRNLLLVVDLEGQINNGGFEQYYFNSYGDNAQLTVNALRAIGANATAELLIESFSAFPNNTPSVSRSERQEQLDNMPESGNELLDNLDDQFYEHKDDISNLLEKYINNNIESFRNK